MLGRLLAMVLGVAGVVAGSQAPNFTTHYMQNLEGRIDELGRIVRSIDSDRESIGYTREMAAETCAGTNEPLFKTDCVRNETIIARFEKLVASQMALRNASDLMRPIVLARTHDVEIAENTAKEFEIAVPVTPDAAAYGGGLGAGLWAIFRVIFGILGAPFRRRYA
ncbi:DUF2937 family protein [Parvularcula sp. LCG005]|uniref:DUF2937 family protein n=1 Tax=Parvularcula sp. LCG005 TaxID=3078805 RepID=UPI0029420B43|nr:DUF2937 family protein [Parvularcula sp. LCG005]WOI53696.1 DUF2937 family protein [Parvularcula sp. LCG005]